MTMKKPKRGKRKPPKIKKSAKAKKKAVTIAPSAIAAAMTPGRPY